MKHGEFHFLIPWESLPEHVRLELRNPNLVPAYRGWYRDPDSRGLRIIATVRDDRGPRSRPRVDQLEALPG